MNDTAQRINDILAEIDPTAHGIDAVEELSNDPRIVQEMIMQLLVRVVLLLENISDQLAEPRE